MTPVTPKMIATQAQSQPVETDFFHHLQRNRSDTRNAIRELFHLLCLETIPNYEKMFSHLFELLPEFNVGEFEQFKDILPGFLRKCPEMKKEQRDLALKLAQKQFEFYPKDDSFSSYCLGMDFCAKAIQISDELKDPELVQEAHYCASFLILKAFLLSGLFKNQLEILRGQPKIDVLKQRIDDIEMMSLFCNHPRNLSTIVAFYDQARDVLPTRPEQQKTYQHLREAIHSKRDKDIHLSEESVTVKYWAKLNKWRNQFQDFIHQKQDSPADVRRFQSTIFNGFKELIQVIVQDTLLLLGTPPCAFDLQAMGSLGREEPCPFSDIELMVVYEDAKELYYFRAFIHLFEIQIRSFGETSDLRIVFTSIHDRNPSGLHLDSGGNPNRNEDLFIAPPLFLGTPKEIEKKKSAMDKRIRESQGNPKITNYTSLKTTSIFSYVKNSPELSCNPSCLIEKYRSDTDTILDAKPAPGLRTLRHQWALDLIQKRCSSRELDPCKPDYRGSGYLQMWSNPPPLNTYDLKEHFIQPLYFVLADIALFKGIKINNTLDIIKELLFIEFLHPKSEALISEAVAALYKLRVRIHLKSKEQKETICAEELTFLEHQMLRRCYWLVLRPLFSMLEKVNSGKIELANIKNLDLVQLSFDEILSKPDSNQSQTWITELASYLKGTDDSIHIRYFKKLSVELKHETLRKIYYDTLKKNIPHPSSLLSTLELIPNQTGFRFALHSSSEEVLHLLLKMASIPTEDTHTTSLHLNPSLSVKMSSFCFPEVELKPEFVHRLLDDTGNIRHSYPGSLHAVTAVNGLHFKQKPAQPLMEYAVHNLMFRLAGNLTPATLLVKCEVTINGQKKIYPVLVSRTIPGRSLAEAMDMAPLIVEKAWNRWTWMLLATQLTRPGDGRFSNYIVDDSCNIYCIDNDISFVESVVRRGLFTKLYFCSALFCLNLLTPLDTRALQEFCDLNVDLILSRWIDDVINQEQLYTGLFSVEERRKLYAEDPEKKFSTTILFKEGCLATLNLQFLHLQKQISSILVSNQPVTALDLLKMLIYVGKKPSADNSIGSAVFQAYKKAWNLASPIDRLKRAVDREHGQSLNSIQSEQATLGKVPTFDEIEQLQTWAPSKAKEELLATLIYRLHLLYPFISQKSKKEGKALQISFKELVQLGGADEERQKLILQGLTQFILADSDKLTAIAISHCAILTSENLDPFLNKEIHSLSLLYCPLIQDRDLERIEAKCPDLKELHLEGLSKLRSFTKGFLSDTPLYFGFLEQLEIKNCDRLAEVKVTAPCLETLIIDNAPLLKSINISAPNLQRLVLNRCPRLYDEEIVKLISQAKATLQELSLADCEKLSSIDQDSLCLEKLRTLNISHCSSITCVVLQLPLLQHVCLINNKKLKIFIPHQIQTFPMFQGDTSSSSTMRIACHEIFKTIISKTAPNKAAFPLLIPRQILEILGGFIQAEIEQQGWKKIHTCYIQPLFQLIELSSKDPEMATTAANAISILNFAHVSLAGKNFQGIRIPGANLGRAWLKGTDLRDADLTKAILSEAGLQECLFDGANLQNVEMRPEIIALNSPVTDFICNEDESQMIAIQPAAMVVIHAETGKIVKKIEMDTRDIRTLALLEKGKKIAVGGLFRSIEIWDLEAGVKLTTFNNACGIEALTSIDKGEKLASKDRAGNIKIWDIKIGVELITFDEKIGLFEPLVFNDETKILISGTLNGEIKIRDIQTGKLAKILPGHTGGTTALSLLGEGRKLISAGSDGKIKIWDLVKERELHQFVGHSTAVDFIVSLDNGNKLASVDKNGIVKVWDAVSFKPIQILPVRSTQAKTLGTLRGGKIVIYVLDNGSIQLWDVERGSQLKSNNFKLSKPTALSLAQNGSKLVSSSEEDKDIRIWDSQTGNLVKKISSHHQQAVSALISFDNELKFLSSSKDGSIHRFDLVSETYYPLQRDKGLIFCMAYLKKSGKLIYGTWRNLIHIIDLNTEENISFNAHEGTVSALALFESENHLLSSSYDKTVRLWDIATRRSLKVFNNFTHPILALALSHDEKRFVSGSDNSRVQVWDIETGQEICEFKGHSAPILALVPLNQLANGQMLASMSSDKTIRIWCIETGREILVIPTYKKMTTLVYQAPDLLFGGYESGGICCWKLHFERGPLDFSTLWTLQPTFSCDGIILEGIKNLSEFNRSMMLEYGAKNSKLAP